MEVVLTESSEKVQKLYDENTGAWKLIRKDRGPLKSIRPIESMLQKLGLSKNEIRVYIFLARSRERKASEISEGLSLHRTETYRILRDLEKIGLVSSVFEKPLKFIATSFEQAIGTLIEAKKLKIRQLEKNKAQLIKIWMALPKPEIKQQRKEVFQILEGEEQIVLKANEIVQIARREIDIFATEEDISRLYHSGFIDRLERFARKAKARLLTNDSPKSRFFVNKLDLPNVRYARPDAKEIPTFILVDQEQLLFTIRKTNRGYSEKGKRGKIAALWTNYDAFVETLSRLFLELWKTEKKLSIVSQT